MPLDYSIDSAERRLHVRAVGPVTADDMWSVRNLIAVDLDYDPTMPGLFDWRGGDFAGISQMDVLALAKVSVTGRSVRRAFVVGRGRSDQLARLFIATERLPAGKAAVFYDREAAAAWLASSSGQEG